MEKSKINPDRMVRMPVDSLPDFFIRWLEFLKPIHHLRTKQIKVLATMLTHRHELSKSIPDSKLVDSILFSTETRRKIKEECGISSNCLQVTLTALRESGVLEGNRIHPRFIPPVSVEEAGKYVLLIYFDFDKTKSI